MGADREQLRRMLQERALLSGTFKLASGATGSYFFDAKQVTLDPIGSGLAGTVLLDLVRQLAPEATAVAGLTVGADPIVTSVALLSGRTDQPLAGLIVRKERKTRGTECLVEGPIQPGMRVVVLDDTVTTGGSTAQAIRGLRETEPTIEIVLAAALVDRLAGFEATVTKLGVPTASVFTLDDFTLPATTGPPGIPADPSYPGNP